MSLPEIAETLDIPLGTAQSRLHRGIAALRAAIGPSDPDPRAFARGQLA
jgi:DNA-directed RNA polymerase specialized sigma24 family protein